MERSQAMFSAGGTVIRPIEPADADAHVDLLLRNRRFFGEWEPIRSDEHYARSGVLGQIEMQVADWYADRGYAFAIMDEASDALIGRITLGHVFRGPWQNAILGYYVDEAHNGRGHATRAAIMTVRFAFDQIGLHRVGAGALPRNERSNRVLIAAGFRFEGLAPRYLNINGVWEDHNLYAITAEEPTPIPS